MRGAVERTRPTLEKVALHAGVSRATVSRVVNGSPSVAPDIRDKVLRAVQELGYVPNPAARSLVTQRTDSIALVSPFKITGYTGPAGTSSSPPASVAIVIPRSSAAGVTTSAAWRIADESETGRVRGPAPMPTDAPDIAVCTRSHIRSRAQ